jgi:hypothetical protein
MPPKKLTTAPKGREPPAAAVSDEGSQEAEEPGASWAINLETLDANMTKDEFLEEYPDLEPETAYRRVEYLQGQVKLLAETLKKSAQDKKSLEDTIAAMDTRTTRATTPGSIMSTVEGRSPKYPDPEILTDGKSPTFKQWRMNIHAKLEANMDHFLSEASRVVYVYGRTGGSAAEHLQPYLNDQGTLDFDTSNELVDALGSIYIDPDEKSTARANYRSLFHSRCKDFMDFHTKFLLYAKMAGIPRFIWKDDYFEKMHPELQKSLAPMVSQLMTFDDLYASARTTQNTLERTNKIRTRPIENRHKPQEDIRKTGTMTTPASNARGKLSDKERSELMATGGCFFCRKPGHTVQGCPDKKALENRRNGIQEVAELSTMERESKNESPSA